MFPNDPSTIYNSTQSLLSSHPPSVLISKLQWNSQRSVRCCLFNWIALHPSFWGQEERLTLLTICWKHWLPGCHSDPVVEVLWVTTWCLWISKLKYWSHWIRRTGRQLSLVTIINGSLWFFFFFLKLDFLLGLIHIFHCGKKMLNWHALPQVTTTHGKTPVVCVHCEWHPNTLYSRDQCSIYTILLEKGSCTLFHSLWCTDRLP